MSEMNGSEIVERQVKPESAAVALQRDFERFAGTLRRCDPAFQDDLVQEMSLGVLQCAEPHTLSFFRSRALSRARDFLRMWRRKSCADWNEITTWPAALPAAPERSRDWYLEKLGALMNGHPVRRDTEVAQS